MVPAFRTPRILFVHGRNPKPPAQSYRAQLWRCLLEGVRRADTVAAKTLAGHPDCFELVYWSDLFYDNTRDIEQDEAGIERVIRLKQPQRSDIAEARRWGRWARQGLNRFIDRMPWLMRPFMDGWMRETVQDTRRYLDNQDGLASRVRARLSEALQATDGQPLVLIGHSLGSVIAYDTLWELTHEGGHPPPVDLFLSLGSPLGTRFIQRGLQGWECSGRERYPAGIRHWLNLVTVGDLAALDPKVEDDFGEMRSLGLVETLTDNTRKLYNSFRTSRGANLHRSYGYLVLPATGRAIVRCCDAPNATHQ